MKERNNKYFDFDDIINLLELESKRYKFFKNWIKHELYLYKSILDNINIQNLDTFGKHSYESQYFTCELFFDKSCTSFYNCEWNINAVKNIIENESIPLTEVNIDEYREYFVDTDINKKHAKIKDINEPIFFANINCLESQKVLIDGNHRFCKALNLNLKSIKAYMLNENQSIRALASVEQQLLYKIYKNLWYIIKIINHQILKPQYDDFDLFQLNNTLSSYLTSNFLLKKML